MTKKLSSSKCKLWLNEKDREALLDGGHLTEEEIESAGRIEVDTKDMLRISTVYVPLSNFSDAIANIKSVITSKVKRRRSSF